MSRLTYIKSFFILCILSLVSLSGCATIIKGTTQNIPVASDPTGADVTVDAQLYGQTPIDLSVKRKRDHLVTISKEGYHSKSIPIVKSVGGAVWGNIVAGGLIGWGIDASTGAQYNLTPESISVKLEPLKGGEIVSTSSDSESEFVKHLNDLDELKDANAISEEEHSSMRTALFKRYFPEMYAEVLGISEESLPPTNEPEELPPPADETEVK